MTRWLGMPALLVWCAALLFAAAACLWRQRRWPLVSE